jgi:hypothetical protein
MTKITNGRQGSALHINSSEPTDLIVWMEESGRMEGMVVTTAEGTLLSEKIIVFI